MYYLKKVLEVAGSHHLNLDYASKCQNDHGHNWVITVYCKARELNESGMVTDFTHIKEAVMQLDHSCLNDWLKQPTAENIAKYLLEQIPNCYQVTVEESKNNEVTYVAD